MVMRMGSKQRKTRHKLMQHYRDRGKISLSRYFQQFIVGQPVGLKIHPIVQKGRFFPRFHGFTGKIIGKQGSCYAVQIKDGNKQKTLYVHPIHLHHAQPALP